MSVVCSTVLRNLFSLSSPELAKTTNEVARKNLKTHRKHDEGWQAEAIFSGYQEMEVTAAGLQWSLQLIICYRTASSQSSNEILVLIRDHQLDTHKKNLELLLPPLPANLCVFFFFCSQPQHIQVVSTTHHPVTQKFNPIIILSDHTPITVVHHETKFQGFLKLK